MPSTISWLDYSEKERRKNLDIVNLFKNQDTRDELGLGTIRDALADTLFPGTGTVQTRARYFLFIPWMYRKLEVQKVSSREIGERARAVEIKLIFALEKSGETDGVVGIEARDKLQRLPSNIYWLGLGVWGIREFKGSQASYHNSLDRWYKSQIIDRNDDNEPLGGRLIRNWNPNIPPALKTFPDKATFALTRKEATFLRDQIILNKPNSLLAFLVRSPVWESDVPFPWMHPNLGSFPLHNQEELYHARHFSVAMHGAALLYNLMLSELTKNRTRLADYHKRIEEWGTEVDSSGTNLESWDRTEFWRLIHSIANVSPRTKVFVNAWVDLILELDRASKVVKHQSARTLIQMREIEIKKKLARLDNMSARELWNGEAGARQLDYRWRNALVIVNDIQSGLSNGGGNA